MVRVDLLAWDGVRQGRGLEPSETRVGVLITRRSQVQILPPLPTRQRYNRRSTARKLSLRAVVGSGEVWAVTRSVTKDRLRCPVVSQVGGDVSRRMGLIVTGLVPRDGVHRVETPAVALPR